MKMDPNFETYLKQKVSEGVPSRTKEAMAYSLMNGGKRVRPQILFALLKDYGFDPKLGYPCACAIEMIHTYSLIHDDLPCMDDDDLRRGKPSCHKAFDEATAVLAGDGLLTKAFGVALESDCLPTQKNQILAYLSEYAGIDGMIYGQDLDMQAENLKSIGFDEVEKIEIYKTAKLLTLPMLCAAILANHKEDIDTLVEMGTCLGIQFQVQDDILDHTSTSEILGKSISDLENHKATAVSLLGLEKAQQLILDLDTKIHELLKNLSVSGLALEQLFEYLIHRTY